MTWAPGVQVSQSILRGTDTGQQADLRRLCSPLQTKGCQAVFRGHTSTINCLLVAPLAPGPLARLYTGSSDKTVRCFSIKVRRRQSARMHVRTCTRTK